MAAVILIGILLGFTTISNDVRKGNLDKSRLYKLFVDTNIDDSKMINYPDEYEGASGGYTETQLKDILKSFTDTYPEIKKIYFVIWDDEESDLKYEYSKGGEVGFWVNPPYSFESRKNYYIMIVEEETEQYVVHG